MADVGTEIRIFIKVAEQSDLVNVHQIDGLTKLFETFKDVCLSGHNKAPHLHSCLWYKWGTIVHCVICVSQLTERRVLAYLRLLQLVWWRTALKRYRKERVQCDHQRLHGAWHQGM